MPGPVCLAAGVGSPFRAKSAASLICLAADELILGRLGEIGPLDQQYDEKMTADFPLSTSRLLQDTALTELQERVLGCQTRPLHLVA